MRRITAMLALSLLGGCGVNLTVHRDHVTGVLPDGREVGFVVEIRPRDGMLQPNFDGPWTEWLAQALVATLLEPIDLVASTGAALEAAFRDDRRVAGGPIGWLAALTPFATLADGPHKRVPLRATLTESQWRTLQDEPHWRRVDVARDVCFDPRIRAVEIPRRDDR